MRTRHSQATKLHNVLLSNIKKYRLKEGLSQAKLAEKADLSSGYIGEIEMARRFPSPEVLERIAIALKIRPYRLLMDSEDEREDSRNSLIRAFSGRMAEIIISEFVSFFEEYSAKDNGVEVPPPQKVP